MKLKLTLDEQELLAEVVQSPTWAILQKTLDFYVHLAEIDIVRYNIKNGEQGLVQAHCKAQGAREVVNKFYERAGKRGD